MWKRFVFFDKEPVAVPPSSLSTATDQKDTNAQQPQTDFLDKNITCTNLFFFFFFFFLHFNQ
jgi:hypothetical protein